MQCIVTQSAWGRRWGPGSPAGGAGPILNAVQRDAAVISSFLGRRYKRPVAYLELAAGLLPVLVLALTAWLALAAPPGFIAAAVLAYAALGVVVGLRWKRPARPLGAANRVTLLRGGLIALIAGTLVVPQALAEHVDVVAALALAALVLDGVDGWVARRTGSASAFGARFDMELDAFLILVLCLCLMTIGKVGAWVVAIGALRYVFVLAMRVLPWLARPLPDSLRRKLVCVWQVASLLASLSSWVQPELAHMLLGVALLLLIVSFGIDIVWLRRRRFAAASASNPFAESAAQSALVPSGSVVPGPDPGQQGSWGGSGQAQQGARS